MSLYKTFATDANLETDGIYLEYGFADDEKTKPIRIRVARAGGSNARFARVLEARTKPYRRQIQTETLDQATASALYREVFADAVILGWENVNDAEGKPLEFNRANVIKVLTDLPELFADIREQAGKAVLFRTDILETDAKN